MQKFCEFSLHEWMDEFPQKKVHVFMGDTLESIETKCKVFAADLSRNYSGGPTKFIKIMNAEEAKAFVEEKCAYEDAHPQEDSEEFKTNLKKLWSECYE